MKGGMIIYKRRDKLSKNEGTLQNTIGTRGKTVFLFFISFICLTAWWGFEAFGSENLEVRDDKDATTYTIGSSKKNKDGKTQGQKDKEQAWDMLKNMNIIVDKRTPPN